MSKPIAWSLTVLAALAGPRSTLAAPSWMPGAPDDPRADYGARQPAAAPPSQPAAAASPGATEGSKPPASQGSSREPAGAGVAEPAARAPAQRAPAKPVKLYGRIEQLCETSGATLPIKLQAQTPKYDASRPLRARASAGTTIGRAVAAYPTEWQGEWSGTLRIWTCQFAPSRWQFDAAEASEEQDLMRPGLDGQVTFNFARDNERRIELQPTQVVFSAPMTDDRLANLMKQMGGGGQLLQGNPFAAAMMRSVPYMYAMHLGDLTSGVGVTGNALESRLVKNEIKALAPGTLEQQIVTYNADRSRATGKVRYSYSESVLRFTKMQSDQLYVQAASVDYDRNGRFESKVVLFGTVSRGAPASPLQEMQLPNMMNGGALQQLQQMLGSPQ